MELKQIECFVACVNYGSFSKAADQLFMNQSNVSRSIRTLEESLNTTLFLRTNKGVTLTLEGERIYQKCLQVLSTLDELGSRDRRPLSFFSVSSPASQYVSYAYAKTCMQNRNDHVVFRLYSHGTSKILQELEYGSVDLGFIYSCQNQKTQLDSILRKKGLVYTPICKAIPSVFIGAANPLIQELKLDQRAIEGSNSICWQDMPEIDSKILKELPYIKMEHDFMESYHDLQGTIYTYGLGASLSRASIVDTGYSMHQMLRETDFCYLGHNWVYKSNPHKIVLPPNMKAYTNFIPLRSGDGEITFGYVTRKEQTQNKHIWNMLQILFQEILGEA